MSTPIIICDDSTFAQKQMARALPGWWDVTITYANNGEEGLNSLQTSTTDILFLDLTMPVLDGFQVLKAISEQNISTKVIVVSGDIQPTAYKRVMELGACAFIKKPIDKTDLLSVLNQLGISGTNTKPQTPVQINFDVKDGYREVANVAAGRAVDLLARFLGAFIVMPIPNVNIIEVSELHMMLEAINQRDSVSAVCQGFIGSGIAGEALLIFNESSFADIAELMKFDGEINSAVKLELLMDISSIFIGACLKSIAEQLDVNFSQSHPIVIGQHVKVDDLVKRSAIKWKKTLAIEMGYNIENRNINCELLLLFTEDSLDRFSELVSYL